MKQKFTRIADAVTFRVNLGISDEYWTHQIHSVILKNAHQKNKNRTNDYKEFIKASILSGGESIAEQVKSEINISELLDK